MHLTNSAHGTRFLSRGHRFPRRLLVGAAVVIASSVSASASGSPGGPVDSGGSASRLPPETRGADWISSLVEALRRLYEYLGGNPGDLSPDPNIAMTQVTAYYAVHGIPVGLTNEQKAAGRSDVESTFPLVPSNSLIGIACRTMLKSLYLQLGGNPNNL